MTDRPILFNGFSISAILAEEKTQTRRVIRFTGKRRLYQSPPSAAWFEGIIDGMYQWYESRDGLVMRNPCPYGQPGDRLWVRETWATESGFDKVPPSRLPDSAKVWYVADGAKPPWAGRLRPGMFMPRWASRIMLEIVSICVERLQQITAIDAMWEGIHKAHDPINRMTIEALDKDSSTGLACIEDFIILWDKINAKRGFPWERNPWVWALHFRRMNP